MTIALTVLSVQQLSDSAKYKFRYQVLHQIGMGTRFFPFRLVENLAEGYFDFWVFDWTGANTKYNQLLACPFVDIALKLANFADAAGTSPASKDNCLIRHPDVANGELLQHCGPWPLFVAGEKAKLTYPLAFDYPGSITAEAKHGEVWGMRSLQRVRCGRLSWQDTTHNPYALIAHTVKERVELPPLRVLLRRCFQKELVYGYIVAEHKLKEYL